MISFIVKKIFGSVNDRIIKSYQPIIDEVNSLEGVISKLSNEELRDKTKEFRARLNQGQTFEDITAEAFCVVREASKRTLKMRHFDVQIMGGLTLHQGKIAEMKTGEGKTLVSTLSAYLNALGQKGVHIVTTNDYLAARDSEWMGVIHKFLGLTIGCITNELSDEQRKAAYNCDITYATNNELGFDYLRDNMKFNPEDMVQRGHNFAIIDEVDSILIDEARTPLVISGPTNDNSKLYEQITLLIPKLQESDYQIEEKEKNVFLTEEGIDNMEKILHENNAIAKNSKLFDVDNMQIVHHVNQALKAHKIFKNEIDYIVKDGEIMIIDEFTGRMQEGRRFSDGLHQALEAKEKVNIKNENQTLASITFQNYFRLYDKLSGMTGTAVTEAVEFEEIYKLSVVEIPTNEGIARDDYNDEIYINEEQKYKAIIAEITECHAKKQPILVGTVSIEKSELISKLLKKHKLPHNVLNAKYHEKEASIIAQAGTPGAITIATNMAGRGTDIMLGGNPDMLSSHLNKETDQAKIKKITDKVITDKEIVIKAGGLYVLATERHESRRIDNQLRGRSGRQGDPGLSKFFLSLEDDLMRIFGSDKLQNMLSSLGLKEDEVITHKWITKTLEKAQKKVEQRNYEIRKNLLKYDDVINEQRKIIFKKRKDLIGYDDITLQIEKIATELNEEIILNNIPKNSYPEQWDITTIENEIQRIYTVKLDLKSFIDKEGISEEEVINFINKETKYYLDYRKELYSIEIEKELQKQIFLMTSDSEWKDHLSSLDKLRYSINLRAYAQKDPLIEYKRDAFNLFEDMMFRIEEVAITRICHAQIKTEEEEEVKINLLNNLTKSQQNIFQTRSDPALQNITSQNPKQQAQKTIITNNVNPQDRDPNNQSSWGNIGRNEDCPCGSGKKYKKCHGKEA